MPPPVRKRKLSVYSLVPLATHPFNQLAPQLKPSLSFPPQSLSSVDAKATVQGLQIRENEFSFTPQKSPVDLPQHLRVRSRATPSGRAWYSALSPRGECLEQTRLPDRNRQGAIGGRGLGGLQRPGPSPLACVGSPSRMLAQAWEADRPQTPEGKSHFRSTPGSGPAFHEGRGAWEEPGLPRAELRTVCSLAIPTASGPPPCPQGDRPTLEG